MDKIEFINRIMLKPMLIIIIFSIEIVTKKDALKIYNILFKKQQSKIKLKALIFIFIFHLR